MIKYRKIVKMVVNKMSIDNGCEHMEDLRCGRCGNLKYGSPYCLFCGHNWFVTREEMEECVNH